MGLIVASPGVLPPQTFPTLFDDYGGNPFAGEAGALAQNDVWASTVYEYFRQFAPTIPTIPEPTTGGSALPTVSGVNPNASDEYCVFDAAGWDASANNATYRVIFIAKGTDLHLEGTKVITVAGTAGTPRWIVYWDDGTPSNVQDIKPWSLSAGNRVQMPKINYSGADWHYIVGLSWGNVVSDYSNAMARLLDGTSDCTFYRCHKENTGTTISLIFNVSGGNNHTIFECAFLDADVTASNSTEIAVHAGTGHRIISCEGRDNATFLEISNVWGEKDFVLEDCDIYKEQRYDIDGNKDDEGIYVSGEALVGFKLVNGAGTDTALRFYGNRFWGTRQTSPALSSVTSGYPLGSSNTGDEKAYVDMRWNVFQDNTRNATRLIDGGHLSGTHNFSYVRNIIGDFPEELGQGSSINYVLILSYDKTEMYLNTVTNAADAEGLISHWRFNPPNEDFDSMGNFFQDTAGIAQDGTDAVLLARGYKVGYNCWVNAAATYNFVYGNDITPTKASLNMGDFTYKRKKLTGPENSTIADIVPTSSTPSSFTTLVPITGGSGNDQIGSRTGIGVDDIF